MTGTATRRRRAPAMTAEERRNAIIQAALPLLAEHGINVTTAQIAQAADIAEGTVFRVFKDKQELIDATMWSMLQTDDIRKQIAAIPNTGSLADQLATALSLIANQWGQAGRLMHTLAAGGYHPNPARFSAADGGENFMASESGKVVLTISSLIARSQKKLRVSPERAATYLLYASYAEQLNTQTKDVSKEGLVEVVDLLLNGVLEKTSRGETHV